jgi:hypothetical protein
MHLIQITILKRPSQNKKLLYYSFEWGKEKGERIATGIFTYKRPANDIQRYHNDEALAEDKRVKSTFSENICLHSFTGIFLFNDHFVIGG